MLSASIASHLDDFTAGGATDNGIINQQDIFAHKLELNRVELLAYGFFPLTLARHNERAADITVFHEALAVLHVQMICQL